MRAPALCLAWIVAWSTAAAAPLQESAPVPARVAEAQERARAILERGGYQTELPQRRERERRSDEESPPWVRALAWTLVALAGAGVVVALVRAWMARARSQRDAKKPQPVVARPLLRPAAAPAVEELLPDPAALAAEQRFAEAIHALWLRLLRDLLVRPGAVVPGHTDRELARLLATPRRDSIERIVALVERHRFAGLPLGAPEWEEAVALRATLSPRSAA